MKKLVLITTIFCILIASVSLAADVKVQINGQIIDFTDSNGNKYQ